MKLATTRVTQASLDSTKLHLQLTIKEYSSLPLSASYFIITNNPPLSVLLTKTFSYFRSFQLISSVKTCQGSKPVEQRSKSDCHSALQYSALHQVLTSSRNISDMKYFIVFHQLNKSLLYYLNYQCKLFHKRIMVFRLSFQSI